ncbi:MAG: helix-turn-helix domain-containing protein [Nitriliruptoraceae bacterium]
MASGFLSTQQVQDLLDVDASTIYRMAADGRLPAVRIGRQWRFPAEQIEAMLQPANAGATASPRAVASPEPHPGTQTVPSPPTGPSAGAVPTTAGHRSPTAVSIPIPPSDSPLPPEIATATLETVAPALGVSMVVTDLAGRPLTPIVHPAPAIVTYSQDPEFSTACSKEWRGFAHQPHLVPRLQPGRFGFLCAHSFVRQGASLVAMVLAGGMAPEGDDTTELFQLDADRHALVLETLPRTAALLSRFVTADPASTHGQATPV